MSQRPGGSDFALDPIRETVEAADDLRAMRDVDCDEVFLQIGAVAQHAREVARDTIQGEAGSSFHTDNEEVFVDLTTEAISKLADIAENEGCVTHLEGTPSSQLDVFENGYEAGSVPLSTGGLDNIAEWAKQHMSPEQRKQIEEAAGFTQTNLETDREFLEQANSLISALNQENECPALFDLADSVLGMVEQYAEAAVNGTVDVEKAGGGTAPAEVSNAWIIMYRRLSDNGCISGDAKEALRDINPVEDIRDRKTQNVETDVQTARFLLGVEEGSEDGQTVTCSRVGSGQDIRKNLLEAASKGSIQAATIGEHDRGGQVLCAVLTDKMGE